MDQVIGGNLVDADDRYVLTIELEKKGRKPLARPAAAAASNKLKSERRDTKVTVPEVGFFHFSKTLDASLRRILRWSSRSPSQHFCDALEGGV